MVVGAVARHARKYLPLHLTIVVACGVAVMRATAGPAVAGEPAAAPEPPGAATISATIGGDATTRTVASASAEPIAEAPPRPRDPLWLEGAERGDVPILAYPPSRQGARAPLMLFLHGMCDAPQNECPSFVQRSTSGAWIACPRANLACDGGGHIWSGDPQVRLATVQSALARLERELGAGVDTTSPTLVGFSLGSFVAVDVAHRSRGPWKNLLLIGAKIEPDAELLKQSGIRNVLLASGDRDMMKWHMVGVAARLQRRGVRAAYVGMGDVGHWFSRDMNAWLARAQRWFDGEELEEAPRGASATASTRSSG